MNHSDKYVARKGSFLLFAGQDTDTLNANVVGTSCKPAFMIEVVEAAVFSILHDAGATCLSNGTSGTNLGVNFSTSTSIPAGVTIFSSTEIGFTRIALTSGTICCYRLFNFDN